MGSGKHRWKKISSHWSPSNFNVKFKHQFPREFICPISGSLMSDPVIVSSGHSFDRNTVQACLSLSFTPSLPDGSTPDFSTIIPNLALKSTILNWSHTFLLHPPKLLDFQSAENRVRTLMASQKPNSLKDTELHKGFITAQKNQNAAATKFTHADSELGRPTLADIECTRPSDCSSSSEDSVATIPNTGPTTPLPLKTRPSCCSSSSSSDIETLNPNSIEEDDIITKLKSSQVFEQEGALISLRKITRTREDTRAYLCTPRLLSSLRSLITSRYAAVQVNSVAALVNLSLENTNKVKIVRSGMVPPLIDVLKGGFPESQDHACGALFSLALDDQNKTAIGVLGALQPLLHALRSDSERARHDSALALYHLSLVQSNQTKLVKLGSIQVLLRMVRSGHMTSRVLLILCNLASSVEGRAAMLDGGAVECFFGMLSRDEFASKATQESCVAALYGLSYCGLRFKGLAKETRAEEALMKVGEVGSERARGKTRKILEVMRRRDEEEEEVVDWEELLYSGEVSRTR